MKPDRLAIYCDVDGVRGSDVDRMAESLLGLLEQVVTLAVPTAEIRWQVDVDGTTQEGSSATVAEVIRAAKSSPAKQEFQVSLETASEVHTDTFAEVHVVPAPRGSGQEYEAFLQISFAGVLLERTESRRFEELFTRHLEDFVAGQPGATQGFISDDLGLSELPLEAALMRSPQLTRADSASSLRNLAWVMFVNEAMTTRLRGSLGQSELVAYKLLTTPTGGMLVQFTRSLEDFIGRPVLDAWRQLLPLMTSSERPTKPPRFASRTILSLTGAADT